MASDSPEGLCPTCLLKQGLETRPVCGDGDTSTVPSPEDLAKSFPSLDVMELLGRGGMGFVYKARHRKLDRFVALKILSPRRDRDPAFGERFDREARTLARLNHPHIVGIYDSGEVDGLFYFVMEYVDGLNLRRLLETAKIAPEQALAIVPQICEALQYAHDQGIVHRDIKPDNILIDRTGRVKIADFGIAKIVGGAAADFTLTSEGQMMGTPAYMAPEQIEHPGRVDHRADIYSLGVVFYQMLTGELPVGRFAPPSRKVSVDVRLDEVVLRSLENEPGLRYQRASEVKTEVETIVADPRHADVIAPGFREQSKSVASGSSEGGSSAAGRMVHGAAAHSENEGFGGSDLSISDKAILPAFLLAFFLGVFGAHRFYVGKIWTGIFQLCTFGGLGIWATVDWILILCRAFPDGEGRRITAWTSSPADTQQSRYPVRDVQMALPRSAIVAPAIGLLVVAVIKLLSIYTEWNPFGDSLEISVWDFRLPGAFNAFLDGSSMLMTLVFAIPAVLVALGAIQMLQSRARPWAYAGAILAISFPPLHVLGLLVGLWALALLSRRNIRALFANTPASVNFFGWTLVTLTLVTAVVAFNTRSTAKAADAEMAPEAKESATELRFPFGGRISIERGKIAFGGWNFNLSDWNGGSFREPFEQSVPLSADGRFSLDNVNGRVAISGWDENRVLIKAVKRGRTRKSVDAVRIEIESGLNRVAVHTRQPAGSSWGVNRSASVDYTVQIPRHALVERVDGKNGEVVLTGLTGGVAASAVNGELRVSRSTGNLKLSTVNGELTVELAAVGGIQFISLSAVNGGIKAQLPPAADASVSAETTNGSIRCDFPGLVLTKRFPIGQSLKGKLGAGQATLDARTTNGSIRISRSK